MIYDCFMFFNELDVLEVRLHELYDVVDKFVIVESVETHQGGDKPLYFQENKARFKQFSDKIIHIVLTERIQGKIYKDPVWYNPFRKWGAKGFDAWHRERFQRDQIMRGLTGCQEDDIIIVSDADEIPRKEVVEKLKTYFSDQPNAYCLFVMPLYEYFINLRQNLESLRFPFNQWPGSYALRYARIKGKSPTLIRSERNPHKVKKLGLYNRYNTMFFDAGWHFSYLGGFETMVNKYESIAHVELNTAHTKTYQHYLKTIVERHFYQPVSHSFPSYITDNLEKFRDKGFVCDEAMYQNFLTDYKRMVAMDLSTVTSDKTTFGLQITGIHNDFILNCVERYGYHSPEEVVFVQKFLSLCDEPVVFDIGANIGTHALAFCQSAKTVYAFEPQPDIAKILKTNLKDNNLENCVVCEFGLSNQDAEMNLNIWAGNNGGSTLDTSVSSHGDYVQQLPCVFKNGDRFIGLENINKIDFIKMDVESHEANVIEGLADAIQRWQPCIMLEWNGLTSKESFAKHKIFERFLNNYDCIAIEPSLRKDKHKFQKGVLRGIRRLIHRRGRKYIPVTTKTFDDTVHQAAVVFFPKQKRAMIDMAFQGLQFKNVDYFFRV